jgi:hypothetical protein
MQLKGIFNDAKLKLTNKNGQGEVKPAIIFFLSQNAVQSNLKRENNILAVI